MVLVDELQRALRDAREFRESSRLPVREVPSLRRTYRGLEATTRQETDWKILRIQLGGVPERWPRLMDLAAQLAGDPAIDAATGWTPLHSEPRATALWNVVIGPLLERYGGRQPDLEWDEALARSLVADFRAVDLADVVQHQTIAPLNNLRSLRPGVELGPGTAIRPMTDEDRDGLWRHFGGVSPIAGLTLEQLDAWTEVIDDRWAMPHRAPVSFDTAIERIATVVTALRLHHPGMAGTSFLWIRPDPPDADVPGPWGQQVLVAPPESGTLASSFRTDVGPDDGPPLRTLIDRIVASQGNRRVAMALRRFDSAYERHSREDALIDLWIAFEALLVPDGTAELKYRAALRIGWLAGKTADERKEAFDGARKSYDVRSKVVHGEESPRDLDRILLNTRQLARVVLRTWVLTPPPTVSRESIERCSLDHPRVKGRGEEGHVEP